MRDKFYQALVIGASAGGISAVATLLSGLSPRLTIPIMIVQHRLPVLDQFLTQYWNDASVFQVKEADDKDALQPGVAYVAPPNYHLLVEQDKVLSLSIDPKICYARPSIDVLFETAADAYLTQVIGVILTGANSDGTAGLRRIKINGGLTIAQAPNTAESTTMPQSAIDSGVIDEILPLTNISLFLNNLF
ncbi:chemotaxis protein CheB [Anaerolineales bacterium HSG6]|nr:chemotaxis protein CheB [Anaerolineales bacterium HSG6]MDM8531039.1 chemotaxis protein CheB [Anaerolineales bacterium HSG25]